MVVKDRTSLINCQLQGIMVYLDWSGLWQVVEMLLFRSGFSKSQTVEFLVALRLTR